MNAQKLTQEQINKLNEPLPKEAIKPHPTKNFLSSINSIYVTERLNDVFGVGCWTISTEHVATQTAANGKSMMVVCKTTLKVPECGIHYECYGGNDNSDLGDAYKGAITDAITKICSWMGIGAEVWKDKSKKGAAKPATPAPVPSAPAAQPAEPDISGYLKSLARCTNTDQVTNIWNSAPHLKKYQPFIDAVAKRGNELKAASTQFDNQ